MPMLLTPEQQQVVAHDHGPALVFAVAGAGKTTAMVHRIERLVRDGIYAPERILATSFSRATVADIRKALQPWEACERVQVATLHSIGLQILRRAAQRDLIPPLPERDGDPEKAILRRALARARQQRLELPPNLDEQDFLSFVGVCKGNFRYPDPEHVYLPPEAQHLISRAEAPEQQPSYGPLYALFESVRQEMGLITFDDMLLSAWELLHRHPQLLHAQQQQLDCVMVDEFQDVNAVQSELLDLLTASHRNYMAIGDDDQTIYEWRGASPKFILEFPERYSARKYLLRENFRSRASHLALANQIIVHNRQREPKQLSLTRGFEGRTVVRTPEDEREQAQQLVQDILANCRNGYRFDQQAILVRLYAQTPWLEQGLIEALIPYRLIGSVPFYQRNEIRTLLAYLELARYERQLQARVTLTGSQLEGLSRRWQLIANRPVRYLSRVASERIFARIQQGYSLVETLEWHAQQAETPYQAKLVRVLADELKWLCETGLEQPAGEVLCRLEANLRYCQYLRKSSGFPETGEGRAMTVEAFLDYSRQLGSCREFDAHLQQLASQHRDTQDGLSLTTIFRAKGLEWPVVYVPHCNQGYIPYTAGHSVEEERRLFYVAVTRPREQLWLYAMRSLPLSRFLAEASYQQTLEAVQETGELLKRQLATPQEGDLPTLARHSRTLLLQRYLSHWWQAPHAVRRQLHQRLEHLHPADEVIAKAPVAIKSAKAVATGDTPPWQVGESVWSERFGQGTIVAFDPDHRHGAMLEVAFDQAGTVKLLARYANLVRPGA